MESLDFPCSEPDLHDLSQDTRVNVRFTCYGTVLVPYLDMKQVTIQQLFTTKHQ